MSLTISQACLEVVQSPSSESRVLSWRMCLLNIGLQISDPQQPHGQRHRQGWLKDQGDSGGERCPVTSVRYYASRKHRGTFRNLVNRCTVLTQSYSSGFCQFRALQMRFTSRSTTSVLSFRRRQSVRLQTLPMSHLPLGIRLRPVHRTSHPLHDTPAEEVVHRASTTRRPAGLGTVGLRMFPEAAAAGTLLRLVRQVGRSATRLSRSTSPESS